MRINDIKSMIKKDKWFKYQRFIKWDWKFKENIIVEQKKVIWKNNELVMEKQRLIEDMHLNQDNDINSKQNESIISSISNSNSIISSDNNDNNNNNTLGKTEMIQVWCFQWW